MEHHVSINRACEACKRKKTKCDGKKPSCSLCIRIRSSCHYPQRKSKTRARRDRNASTGSVSVADAASTRDMAATPASAPTPSWSKPLHKSIAIYGSPETGSESSSRFSCTDSDPLRHESFSSADAYLTPCHDPASGTGDGGSGGSGSGGSSGSQWNSYPDPFFIPDVPPVVEQSPTDQDMLEYLAQTLPDMWIPDSLTQNIVPRPASTDDQTNIMVCTNPPSDLIHEFVPTPDLTEADMEPLDHIDPSLSASTDVFGVPSSVVDELIGLYFRRVSFLPLFHRPTFSQTYLRQDAKDKYADLPEDSVFIIYGMMALSARFSSSSYLTHLSPHQRGTQFARKAQAMYHEIVQQPKPFPRTLPWLQGIILLAFYNQTCRPDLGCDLTVAACTNFAWDLKLHLTDEEDSCSQSVEEWVIQEAKRRAWWAIWELDTFEGISRRRPFTMDRSRCCVKLPVSDEAWFHNTPVRSAEVNADILQGWKTLKDCPNQDERAWFLISSIILAHALELVQRSRVSTKSISDIDTVVSCFSLLYHENFRKRISNLAFDDATHAKSNWVTCTRIMIHSAKIAISILEDRSPCESIPVMFPDMPKTDADAPNDATPRQSPEPTAAAAAKSLHRYRQPAAELFRVFQAWAPDVIGFAPPTLACLVTGPCAVLLRCARQMRREQHGGDTAAPSIQEDLLVLILRHFAHYWNIGIFLLDFVRAFKDG